jgi:pyruvate/2-oxoglutarate dehydrogenase complex dihydrolipoamide dehydrogenase (E3) component
MVASARVAHLARRAGDYGVTTGPISVDMKRVRERKRGIVDAWSAGNRRSLEEQEGLELIQGEAAFSGSHEVTVSLRDGGTRILRADRIFVNTGGRPRIPDIPGLEEVDFLDSTSIMELDEVPEHLLVIGGGFIGLEFAQMFRRFGARITILERGSRLAPQEDPDVCHAIQEILEEDGVSLRLGVTVTAVRPGSGGGAAVRFRPLDDGGSEAGTPGGDPRKGDPAEEVEVRGSHLLVAVGRTPNTDALNPGAAGLALDERGHIRVNDRLETGIPGIYALGDVNGGPPFTHIAYDDFRIVRKNLLENGTASRAGRVLPYTVYIDPELGRVGLSETQAREAGHEIRVAKLPMSRVARAVEREETRGFMKAVVDARSRRLLGAAVLGVEGGEVCSMLQLAMMGDLPFTALRDAIFTHPTLAESLNTLFATLES